MKTRQKLLFVCTHNQWRSPTAEKLYRGDERFEVRSGGTSPRAVHPVSARDVAWADLILCMERKHQQILVEKFGCEIATKIKVLAVPDEWPYMHPELVQVLLKTVEAVLAAG